MILEASLTRDQPAGRDFSQGSATGAGTMPVQTHSRAAQAVGTKRQFADLANEGAVIAYQERVMPAAATGAGA